jgi:calcium-dependent protein kinase
MAPQILSGEYTEKCDIWSCGVILYILLCGYPPINARMEKDLIAKVQQGKFKFAPEDWDNISDSAKDLIQKMMAFNETERLTANEALSHPWIVENKTNEDVVSQPLMEKALQNLKSFHVFSNS